MLCLSLSDGKEQVAQIPKPHNLESFSLLIIQCTVRFILPLLYQCTHDQAKKKKKKGNNTDFLNYNDLKLFMSTKDQRPWFTQQSRPAEALCNPASFFLLSRTETALTS